MYLFIKLLVTLCKKYKHFNANFCTPINIFSKVLIFVTLLYEFNLAINGPILKKVCISVALCNINTTHMSHPGWQINNSICIDDVTRRRIILDIFLVFEVEKIQKGEKWLLRTKKTYLVLRGDRVSVNQKWQHHNHYHLQN